MIHKNNLSQVSSTKQTSAEELIARINESIKRGVAVMEDKYERVEVVDSDSEEEGDDPNIPRLVIINILFFHVSSYCSTHYYSVILRAKDPYQDRPLPYVIGSEKWKNSCKIGLESSSDSEHQEDEGDMDEESESDLEKSTERLFPGNQVKSRIGRMSSSSSAADEDFERRSQHISSRSAHASNRDTLEPPLDSILPNEATSKSPSISGAVPNFAEELARRLGKVLPAEKSVKQYEDSDTSINRSNSE